MSTTTIEVPAPRVVATTRRGATLRMFAVLLLLTAALRLPGFFVDVFNSDETFLATQAQVIRAGGDLYTEAADRKPPLVPYLYAATFALFGTTALWTARVMAMLAVALTALLVAQEARHRYGARAAWVAGVLLVLGSVALAPQDGQAANFEIFMLPAMTAAVVLARRGRGLWAGVAIAVATLAKQTGAATLLPVLYLVTRKDGRRGARDLAIGFAAPIATVALLLGPGQLFYWTVLGNGSYIGMRTLSTYVLQKLAIMSLAWAACNLPLLWKMPSAWKARTIPREDGRDDTDLWLWLASAIVSVSVGLRFFGHYYLQLLPPLVLLTTAALIRARGRVLHATIAAAALGAVAFSAAGYFMAPFATNPRYHRVSKYLAANTTRNDEIFVWGNVPEIYWASGIRPATRLIATNSLLADNHAGRPPEDVAPQDSDPRIWDWLYADFAKHPPAFVVDSAPAAIRGAQFTPIADFPRLAAILARDYVRVRTIDGFVVYARRLPVDGGIAGSVQTSGHGTDR